jgi:hypothetical protein
MGDLQSYFQFMYDRIYHTLVGNRIANKIFQQRKNQIFMSRNSLFFALTSFSILYLLPQFFFTHRFIFQIQRVLYVFPQHHFTTTSSCFSFFFTTTPVSIFYILPQFFLTFRSIVEIQRVPHVFPQHPITASSSFSHG